MKIHRISVPTPFYVGPVNVYLIEEDPLTLIDAGPRDDASLAALRSGLAQLGHKLSDIKRIIISHAHADHYGLAKVVSELEQLAKTDAKFAPAEILRTHARNGTKFYES